MNKILYVDVGCRHNPGPYEIRGVVEGQQVFYEEFKMGSNNVGEYLALYWGLFVFPNHEVYTDSLIALSWARRGKCGTKCPMDERTRRGVERANKYFTENSWAFKRVKHWDTPTMGENPADFGRKYIKGERPTPVIPVIPIVPEKKVIKSGWVEIMQERNTEDTELT